MGAPGLGARLDELLAVDQATMTHRERADHVGEIERVRTRIEARSIQAIGEFDEVGAWMADEAYSARNWMAAQTGTSKADAGRRVRLARQLRSMPGTAAAFAAGEITVEHVRLMARCVANPRTRAAFSWDESTLVAQARQLPADDFEHRVRLWMAVVDQDGAPPSDPEHDVVNATRVGDRVKINGDLGLDTGIPFLAALAERMDVLFERDKKVSDANPEDGLSMRTPGNRRAEALCELVAAGAGAESNPRRREPLFNVHIDERTLRTRQLRHDTRFELDDGTVLGIQFLDMWAGGAIMNRVLLDARRVVLDLGREERYANRAQRRALAARDRGCAVPGCDRPPEHCDAHHIVFWDDWGATDLDNLVLLCRHHHRSVHAGRLRVEMIGRLPQFFDQFGRRIGEGRHRPSPVAA